MKISASYEFTVEVKEKPDGTESLALVDSDGWVVDWLESEGDAEQAVIDTLESSYGAPDSVDIIEP